MTIRQNNLMNVTSKAVMDKVGMTSDLKAKDKIYKTRMKRANHSILEAKFKLKQVVDTGDLHGNLEQSRPYKF